MSQSSLDDDELFGEAAEEMRAEVEGHIEAARDALPDDDALWEVDDGGNTLGVLNTLKTALNTEEVASHVRDAKKAFVIGQRADAFDGDDLADDLAAIEDVLADLEAASEHAGALAETLPELRGALPDE
ncbi:MULTISPECIES: DUF5790 family protein [Halobacterium]|uniref:Uncharacterized protein n=1 Tax=Halobacterium salinarum (strain ATCC 33171 / DSM 3754 / JCM 8978 / NBRC 102687 / NCIMB 764 / 91-R6) TaxID=2597657 RepID=A0A4D6GUL7_HALS9|nr:MULTISPECIES: DUF5790 family protein [Halobacterium]MCF2164704.1 hypothetical protein [Halobacterium salinarum]MCF2166850.1 hypothetical protein [Halobacterium salinarum]MCF2206368.1 hypothetical protein [Halobacterium salinarum]MCF2241028.1 hypothetical protein [Halobacterium salinarum]MDL0120269.1 DUF5790 family protein [Halobacterium salinarum]